MEIAQRPKHTGRKRKRRPQFQLSATTKKPVAQIYWHDQFVENISEQSSKEFQGKNENEKRENVQIPKTSKVLHLTLERHNLEQTDREEADSTVMDLKSLLKKSGGDISLSEILQRKNLTLEDLIKGKKHALQILQSTVESRQENLDLENRQEEYNEDSKIPSINRSKESVNIFRKRPLSLINLNAKRRRINNAMINNEIIINKMPKNISTAISLISLDEDQNQNEEDNNLEKQENNYKHKEGMRYNGNNNHERNENQYTEDSEATSSVEMKEIGNFTTANEGITIIKPMRTAAATTSSTTEKILTPLMRTRIPSTLRRNVTPKGIANSNIYHKTIRNSQSNARITSRATTTSTILPSTLSMMNVTTTASSSTMNLTPNTSYTLNTENFKERLQESLLKSLIENENLEYKKPNLTKGNVIKRKQVITKTNDKNVNYDDEDNDLENFWENANQTTLEFPIKHLKDKNTSSIKLMKMPTQVSTKSKHTSSTPFLTSSVLFSSSDEIPDFDNIDDRTDLLELIEDHRSGNSLFKVLQQRNMSLEQLIEHRKRGSSQLHLATIVQNPRGLFPDKKVVLQDNLDIVTAFENFPHFNLLNLKSVKPDDIKTDSQGASYFTSIIDIEPTDDIYKNGDSSSNREFNPRHHAKALSFNILTADRNEKSSGFITPWQSVALASLAETKGKQNQASSSSSSLPKSLKATTTKLRNYYLEQPKFSLNTKSTDLINDFILNKNQTMQLQEANFIVKPNENYNDNYSANDNVYIEQYNHEDTGKYTPLQAAVKISDNAYDDIVIHEIVGQQQQSQHDIMDLELSSHGFKRSPETLAPSGINDYFNDNQMRQRVFNISMPAGIKFIVVGSTTIVLTVTITFMLVFAICRWKKRLQLQQQQRNTRGVNDNSGISTLVKKYYAIKSKLCATVKQEAATNSCSLTPSPALSLTSLNHMDGGAAMQTTITPISATATTMSYTPLAMYTINREIDANIRSNSYNNNIRNKGQKTKIQRERSSLMLSNEKPLLSLAINVESHRHPCHQRTTKQACSNGAMTNTCATKAITAETAIITASSTTAATIDAYYNNNNGLMALGCHTSSPYASTNSLALSL